MTFEVEDADGCTELDACVTCQFLWFDASELARLGIALKDRPPTQETARAVAKLRVDTLRENHEFQSNARSIRELLYILFWRR